MQQNDTISIYTKKSVISIRSGTTDRSKKTDRSKSTKRSLKSTSSKKSNHSSASKRLKKSISKLFEEEAREDSDSDDSTSLSIIESDSESLPDEEEPKLTPEQEAVEQAKFKEADDKDKALDQTLGNVLRKRVKFAVLTHQQRDNLHNRLTSELNNLLSTAMQHTQLIKKLAGPEQQKQLVTLIGLSARKETTDFNGLPPPQSENMTDSQPVPKNQSNNQTNTRTINFICLVRKTLLSLATDVHTITKHCQLLIKENGSEDAMQDSIHLLDAMKQLFQAMNNIIHSNWLRLTEKPALLKSIHSQWCSFHHSITCQSSDVTLTLSKLM